LNTEKVNSFIGLAQKGRMLEIGKTAVDILIKRKRAHLVIIAADASEKLKKKIEIDCRRQNVPVYIYGTKSKLGELCNRESVGTIAVSNRNLAQGIKVSFN